MDTKTHPALQGFQPNALAFHTGYMSIFIFLVRA